MPVKINYSVCELSETNSSGSNSSKMTSSENICVSEFSISISNGSDIISDADVDLSILLTTTSALL